MIKKYKQPISVLVLIYSGNQALLIRRADGDDLWQSVTGSVEEGETLLQTAQREVLEETGFQAALGCFEDWQISQDYEIYPRWRYRYAPDVTHNREHVFAFRLPEKAVPTLNPREHLAYCWIDIQAASQRVFSPSNADALRLLTEKIMAGISPYKP